MAAWDEARVYTQARLSSTNRYSQWAIFKREDEGGLPSRNGSPAGSGANTPARGYSRSPAPPGAPGYGQYANGDGAFGKRHVPGAPPGAGPGVENDRKGPRKKKGGKNKGGVGGGGGDGGTADGAQANGITNGPKGKKGGHKLQQEVEETVTPPSPPPPEIVEPTSPTSPGTDAALDSAIKRIRNLNKKVRLIFFFLMQRLRLRAS